MTVPGADPTGLSVGEIHVWTARLVDGDRATDSQLGILCREERARAAQFAFERDRASLHSSAWHRTADTRWLLRYGPRDTDLCPQPSWEASSLPRGGNGPNLQFSVSHSGDCCMLALRRDHAIGVDIEKLRELPQAAAIAQSYFTAAESECSAALQGTAQRDAFFLLWTHKEATVKALGHRVWRLTLAGSSLSAIRPANCGFAAWDGDTSVTQRWSILRLDLNQAMSPLSQRASDPIADIANWNGTGAD